MKRRDAGRRAAAVAVVWIVLAAMPASAQTMKVTAQSIPIPTDDEPQELTEVSYGSTWSVGYTSIRLQIKSKAEDAEVIAAWTPIGTNSRPRPEWTRVTVLVLDADGKVISKANKAVMIRSGGEPREVELATKVKAEDWAKAERVEVQAHFFIAT